MHGRKVVIHLQGINETNLVGCKLLCIRYFYQEKNDPASQKGQKMAPLRSTFRRSMTVTDILAKYVHHRKHGLYPTKNEPIAADSEHYNQSRVTYLIIYIVIYLCLRYDN